MNQKLLELIIQAQAGDGHAFEKVIEMKQREILYITASFCNQDEIEDNAQEAMITMYGKIQELKEPESFSAWMYSIIKNTCNDNTRRRKAKKRDGHLTSLDLITEKEENQEFGFNESRKEFLPMDYVEQKEKRQVMMEALKHLPDSYRECLLLFYYEELTYKEIAATLQVTEKQVSNNLQRARRKLKAYLESHENSHFVFSTAPIGAIPVLTRFFQADAKDRITDKMMKNISDGIQHFMQNPAAQSATVGTTAGAVTKSAAAGSSVLSKVVAGVILTGVIGGAAVGVYQMYSAHNAPAAKTVVEATPTATPEITEVVETPPLTLTPPSITPPPETPPPTPTEEPVVEEVMPTIDTLEAMIGDDYAAALAAYQNSAVPPEEWDAFVQGSGLEPVSTAEEERFTYVVYLREEQNCQLIVVTRKTKESEPLDVRYRFGEIEPLGSMMNYILMF